MKIVHIGSPGKKPSKKELEREKAKQWILRHKAINSKKAMEIFAKDIHEIRSKNPDFMISRTAHL